MGKRAAGIELISVLLMVLTFPTVTVSELQPKNEGNAGMVDMTVEVMNWRPGNIHVEVPPTCCSDALAQADLGFLQSKAFAIQVDTNKAKLSPYAAEYPIRISQNGRETTVWRAINAK